MWVSNIENQETIKAIYKNRLPKINDVNIQDLVITAGDDMDLNLRFDIDDLPDDMPLKWKALEVNTIQLNLSLVNCEIKHLGLNGENYKHLSLDIYEIENGVKKIIGTENSGKCVFEFEAKWIYVNTVSGYQREFFTE